MDEDRRRLLKQLGAVAGISAGAAYVSLAPRSWPFSLSDPDGTRGTPAEDGVRLPKAGFAVDPSSVLPHLGVARGADAAAMVRAAIDAIGGIRRFVRPGDVVLVKPNAAFERSAALGATTNPAVVGALVRLCREAGAAEVRVADNPIESPAACFARSGIGRAAADAGAGLFLPTPSGFRLLETPGATHLARWPVFWRPLAGATKVIGVAPAKDHVLCGASMTTKNWYGLLGGRRNQLHQEIHGAIADLALALRPTLVVLDGTRVLFRGGPTGGSLADVREGRTIAASTDSLALDAFGWDDLLGRKDDPLPQYLEKAAARGLGNPSWRSVNVREVRVG